MRTRMIITTLLGVAALTLSGCSDDGDTNASGSKHNGADVTFAQGMIPHHEQAVEMAKLATDRASSPDVKQLAADIEAAQGPEIQTMTGWLEAWGEDVPSGEHGMGGMDHGDMSGDDMPGMMSDADMEQLRDGSGAAFDKMFLTMMIEHHEGAIEMADTEQSDGENDEAVALAKKIETDQKAEIEKMRGLLGS